MNRYRDDCRQGGFTLVELIIGMLLTVTLMTAVFGLLSTSVQSWLFGGSKMELQQTARHAVDLIARDLYYANSISPITNATMLTLVTEQYLPAKTITYSLSGTSPFILRRDQNDGSGAQPVTGGSTIVISITALQFTALATNSSSNIKTVGISLTATDITSSDPNKQQRFQIKTAVTAINIPD